MILPENPKVSPAISQGTAKRQRRHLARRHLPLSQVTEIIDRAAAHRGLNVADVIYGGNLRDCVLARREAIKRLHDAGMGISDIGRHLKLHHTSVFYHLEKAAI